MKDSISTLTQSKFYSPAFNSAIFDGPFRIYFAQHQEATALQLYFRLQNELDEHYHQVKEMFKDRGPTVFIMIYPDGESFNWSFDTDPLGGFQILDSKIEEDTIVGFTLPSSDEDFDRIYSKLVTVIQSLKQEHSDLAPLSPSSTDLQV